MQWCQRLEADCGMDPQLVGLQACTTTLEISLVVPQKPEGNARYKAR